MRVRPLRLKRNSHAPSFDAGNHFIPNASSISHSCCYPVRVSSDPITPQLAQVAPPHPLRAALKPIAIALGILIVAGFLVVHFTHQEPAAAGGIVSVTVFPVHTVSQANLGVPGTLGEAETHDELYILADVKVQNRQGKFPLFIQSIAATYTPAQGDALDSIAASAGDLPRFHQAYPAAPATDEKPFPPDTRIEPGQTAQGLVLLHFPITPDVWAQRKSAVLTVTFYHQDPLTLPLAVTPPATPK